MHLYLHESLRLARGETVCRLPKIPMDSELAGSSVSTCIFS